MENCPVCNEIYDGKNCKNCGFEETINRWIERFGTDSETVQKAKKLHSEVRPLLIKAHRRKWFQTFREFKFSGLGLEKYNGVSSTVIVPYGVTDMFSFDGGAFSNNLTVKRVVLPDSITSIGFKSFMGCKNLEYVEIPDGVTKIERATFQNCNSLNLSIPKNVSEIEEGAITCVKHIDVHNSNPYFRVHQGMLIDFQRGVLLAATFENPNMDILVPNYVKRIGASAFRIVSNSPNSIILPNGLESIGSGALACFTKVPTVIPKSVTEIEDCAFPSSNVILEDGNPNYIMRNNTIIDVRTNKLITICNKDVSEVIIPSGVEVIASHAFFNCKNLMEVFIPKSVKEIGDFAFYGCCALKSIVIPYYVTQMGKIVFGNCSHLKTIFCERKLATNGWNSVWMAGCDAYVDDGKDVVKNSSNQVNTARFDEMDGHEFERFCANVLRQNGFENVSVTIGSGDQGIDIIAYKDGIKYGIQCKCYHSDIGNKAVQEVYAGKTFYNCHVGIVLTNRDFTRSAIDLAEKDGIILWNRTKLLQMIENCEDII